MFIKLYIARPTYHFILIYTCGLTVVIKRICHVMLLASSLINSQPADGTSPDAAVAVQSEVGLQVKTLQNNEQLNSTKLTTD